MFSYTKKNYPILMVFSAMLLLTAGHNYYMATPAYLGTNFQRAATIDSLKLGNMYFILRNGNESFYMSNAILNQDHKTVECTLDTVLPYNKLHLTHGRRGKMQYKKSVITDLNVLNEVHIYIPPDTVFTFGKYSLDLNKVQKIEVIEKDKKRTTNSYVIGAAGITVGSLVLVVGAFCLMFSGIDFTMVR